MAAIRNSHMGLMLLLSSAFICLGLGNDGDNSDLHLSPSEEWKVGSFLLNDPFLREKFRSKAISRPQATTKRYGVVPFDDSTHVKGTKTRHFPADDKYQLSLEDLFDHRSVEKWIPITELLFKGFHFDTALRQYSPAKYATDTGFTEHTKAVIDDYTRKPHTAPKVKYATTTAATPNYDGYQSSKAKYDTTSEVNYLTTTRYDNKPRYEPVATTPKYDTYAKAKGDTYEHKDRYQNYPAKSAHDTYTTVKYDTYTKAATPKYDLYDTYSSTPKYDTYNSKTPNYDTLDYQKKLYDRYPATTTPKYNVYSKSSVSQYDTFSSTPKYNTYTPKPGKYDTPYHQDKLHDRYPDTTTPKYNAYSKYSTLEYDTYSSTPKYDTYKPKPDKYETQYHQEKIHDRYPATTTPKYHSYQKPVTSDTYTSTPTYDTSSSYKGIPPRHHKTPSQYTPYKDSHDTTKLRYHDKVSVYDSKENTDYRPSGYKPLYNNNEGYDIYVPEEYSDSYFAIPGVAGKDYPIYDVPPLTKFNCGYQDYAGYYADVGASCQVFHICQADGRANAFLCPNGTIFNQQYLVCDWWYNFNCESAPSLYKLNAYLYEEKY